MSLLYAANTTEALKYAVFISVNTFLIGKAGIKYSYLQVPKITANRKSFK